MKIQESADYLKFGSIEGLSKGTLIRKIRDYLNEVCEKEEEDEQLIILFEDILAFYVVPIHPWRKHQMKMHKC